MFIPMPTTRGKILIALTIGAFAVSMVNANPTTALITALFCALLISSFLFSLTAVAGLKIIREPCCDGVLGETTLLPLKIINVAWRPRQTVIIREHILFSANKFDDFAVHSLAVSEQRTLERVIVAHKRGSYNFNKVTLIGGDSLGIFKVTKAFNLPGKIVVYPATVRISQIPLDLKHKIRVTNNGRPFGVSGQGQEIFGIREYRPGDPVRLINWKASAKQRKMVVKEFEAHAITRVNILLDVNSKDIGDDPVDNNFEYLISTAASIVRYLSGVYCDIAFVAGKKNHDKVIFESGTAYSAGKRIMDVLADLQPADVDLKYLIDSNIHVFQPNSVLYCLTLSQTETDRQILSELIDSGVDVRWIYAPKESFSNSTPEIINSTQEKEIDRQETNTPTPRRVVPGMHIADAILT